MIKPIKLCLYTGPLLLMFVLACTPGISFTEDFGRHLLLGQIIVENGFIPKTNYLTYTYPNFPFVNHHWLSEVVFYLLHSGIGVNGLILFKMLIMTATLALALSAVRQGSDKRGLLLWISAIIAAVILGFRAHLRPELFTYFCVALLLFIFEKIRTAKSTKSELLCRILIVLTMVVWANFHIYFIFGVGMLGAFFIERCLKVINNQTQHSRLDHKCLKEYQNVTVFKYCFQLSTFNFQLLKEGIWLVVPILLCCFNPNGYEGFLYPFKIFSNYGVDITENLSPLEYWQKVYNPMLIVLPILSGIVISILVLQFVKIAKDASQKNIDPISNIRFGNVIIVIAALIASWMMARSAPLLALTALPVIAGQISIKKDICRIHKKGRLVVGMLVIALLNIWLIYGVVEGWYCRIFPSPIGPTPFGFEITGRFQRLKELKQKHGLKGPIFSDYNIGSLVEYELWPEKGYVDNRPEAFPESFWKNEYEPALALGAEWESVCEQRKINTVIVSLWGVKEFYIQRLVQNPKWVLVHLDEMTAVFVKNIPANQGIIEHCGLNKVTLQDYSRKISEDILALSDIPWWKRQVTLDSIVYRLYSLICIGRYDMAWPYLWQLHKQYPDYQLIHELVRVAIPKYKIAEFNSVLAARARWPLAAKQVLDWGRYLESIGSNEKAKAVYKRGLWFFPLSKELQEKAELVKH